MSDKGLSRDDSGEILAEESPTTFGQFLDSLKKKGVSDDYATGDVETDAQRIADALAEHQTLKADKGELPEQYDFAIPGDMQHPDGAQWTPGSDDPQFVSEITDIFKKAGIDQGTASQFAKAYAGHTIRKAQAAKAQRDQAGAARDAEYAKLGPKGTDRVDALWKAVAAHVGDDGAQALQHGGSAAGIEAMEKLIQKVNGASRGAPARGQNTPAKPDLSKLNGRELLRQSYAKG